MNLNPNERHAIACAQDIRLRAHAPYSGKHVGAAVITVSGAVFAACNVENANAALRVCAERNAIAQAIAAGHREFDAVIVLGPDERFWPPCTECRAVILEFAANPRILMCNADGLIHAAPLADLDAIPFSRDGEEMP